MANTKLKAKNDVADGFLKLAQRACRITLGKDDPACRQLDSLRRDRRKPSAAPEGSTPLPLEAAPEDLPPDPKATEVTPESEGSEA